MNKGFIKILVCFSLLVFTQVATSGIIVQATSVSSPSGSYSAPYNIEKSIDQSGLSASYISGVTNFESYVATTTHSGVSNSGFLGYNDRLPELYTFDLGDIHLIDALAFWSVDNIGSVTEFELYADTDSNFTNGTTQQLGGVFKATNLGDNVLAQVFSFTEFATRYVHLNILGPLPASLEYGIGEVAFRTPVPIPAAAWLFGSGLVGLLSFGRKRKQAHQA